jgi:hypothetical protein
VANDQLVRCPICLHCFPWPDPHESDEWYRDDGSNYEQVAPAVLSSLRSDPDGTRLRIWLSKAYVRCPNPFLDRDHWLQYQYGKYGDPFIIGMVGETDVGKSHLLAAMIGQLTVQNKLADLALAPEPVDRISHSKYVRDNVIPLLQESQGMPGTAQRADRPVEFVDALTLHLQGDGDGPSRQKTVAFFDVSGEDLRVEATSAEFIRAAHGLIFVVDPGNAGLLGRSSRRSISDPTFEIVLSQLFDAGRHNRHTELRDVAAAVVVAKADLLRHERTVAPWYGRDRPPGPLDAAKIEEESQAAYALLYANGAESWLMPVERCERATLHFASATGGSASGNPPVYPRGVRPRRVLEPLLAVLAMGGILTSEYVTGGQVGI